MHKCQNLHGICQIHNPRHFLNKQKYYEHGVAHRTSTHQTPQQREKKRKRGAFHAWRGEKTRNEIYYENAKNCVHEIIDSCQKGNGERHKKKEEDEQTREQQFVRSWWRNCECSLFFDISRAHNRNWRSFLGEHAYETTLRAVFAVRLEAN